MRVNLNHKTGVLSINAGLNIGTNELYFTTGISHRTGFATGFSSATPTLFHNKQ
jgi:hypothetical protein